MTATQYPELPKSDVWVIPGDDNASVRGFLDAKVWTEDEFTKPMFTAEQMRSYADATCALRGAQSDIHLAWRGALKACGVGSADVDAIGDVVLSMLAEPIPSAPTPKVEAK